MIVFRLILYTSFLLCSYLTFAQNERKDSYSLFQKKCELIFRNIDGCLGVIDLKSNKIITTINSKILFNESYKPGSIIKILTSISAVKSSKVDYLKDYNCNGKAEFDNELYRCWLPKGHSKVNLIKALSQSCNLYFLNIASQLSLEELFDTFSQFRFGEKTTFNYAGESPGTFIKVNNNLEKYYLAIGCSENLLVTPAQLLQMISFIAKRHIPESNSIILKNSIYDPIYKGLRNSVLFGTSKESNYLKFPPAGKTGTISEKYNHKNSAWFVGYAPYYDPEIAIVIFIKKGRGATNAAPLARKVFKCYYEFFH